MKTQTSTRTLQSNGLMIVITDIVQLFHVEMQPTSCLLFHRQLSKADGEQLSFLVL